MLTKTKQNETKSKLSKQRLNKTCRWRCFAFFALKMVIDLRPQKAFVVVFPFIKKVGPLWKKKKNDVLIPTKLTFSVTEKLETFSKIPGDVKLNQQCTNPNDWNPKHHYLFQISAMNHHTSLEKFKMAASWKPKFYKWSPCFDNTQNRENFNCWSCPVLRFLKNVENCYLTKTFIEMQI